MQTVTTGTESKKDVAFRANILEPIAKAFCAGEGPLNSDQLQKLHHYLTVEVGRVSLPLLSEALEGVATLATRRFIAERFNGESFRFPHIMDVLFVLSRMVDDRRVELKLDDQSGVNDLRTLEIGTGRAR